MVKGEGVTSELQLAKRLVNDRGRDLVFIVPGSLGKYDIRRSLVGRESFPVVQSGETDHGSEFCPFPSPVKAERSPTLLNLDPVEIRPGPEGLLDSTELTEKDLPGSMPYFKSAYKDDELSWSCPGPAVGGPVAARLPLEALRLIPSPGSPDEGDSLRR